MHQIQEFENKIKKLKLSILFFSILTALLAILCLLHIWQVYPTHADKVSITTSPLLDPELNQYPREDMILNIQPLRESLIKLEDKYKNETEISLYLEVLNTGANISINKEMRIWPVSLTKLPTVMAVIKNSEIGKIDLNDTLKISEDDLNSDSGELYKLGAGHQLSVEDAIKIMLHDSDNTAYNALKSITTEEDLNSVLNSVGLGEIFKSDGSVSAKEYNRLLRSIYSGVYLSRKNSAYLIEIMTNTTFNDFLSQGIPKNIKFAHKWGGGYREKIYADAGIVYTPNRPYMITVMIKGKDHLSTDESATLAKQIFKEISTTTTTYIINYHP